MTKKSLVISKANTLARSSSTLDLTETKVVEYCLANIHYTEDFKQDKLFRVDVDIMSKHFNMDRSLAYRELKRIAISIMSKTIKIPNFEKPEDNVLTHWVSSVIYNDNTEKLELRFSHDVIPYLTGEAIRNNFTSYALEDVANFRGLYCNRLYNLCKSHAFKGVFEITLPELRTFLDISDEKYPSWGDLKRVINKTIEEIREKTGLNITMIEAGKLKGRVNLLEFRLQKGNNFKQLRGRGGKTGAEKANALTKKDKTKL
jgi:plasmid replication initiation protein